MCEEDLKIPVPNMKLVHAGEELFDGQTLESSGLKGGGLSQVELQIVYLEEHITPAPAYVMPDVVSVEVQFGADIPPKLIQVRQPALQSRPRPQSQPSRHRMHRCGSGSAHHRPRGLPPPPTHPVPAAPHPAYPSPRTPHRCRSCAPCRRRSPSLVASARARRRSSTTTPRRRPTRRCGVRTSRCLRPSSTERRRPPCSRRAARSRCARRARRWRRTGTRSSRSGTCSSRLCRTSTRSSSRSSGCTRPSTRSGTRAAGSRAARRRRCGDGRRRRRRRRARRSCASRRRCRSGTSRRSSDACTRRSAPTSRCSTTSSRRGGCRRPRGSTRRPPTPRVPRASRCASRVAPHSGLPRPRPRAPPRTRACSRLRAARERCA